jgi:hypothetical protein
MLLFRALERPHLAELSVETCERCVGSISFSGTKLEDPSFHVARSARHDTTTYDACSLCAKARKRSRSALSRFLKRWRPAL